MKKGCGGREMRIILLVHPWRNFSAITSAFFEDLSMRTQRKIKPGMPGAKKLMELYGSKLVCVRYRYDSQHLMRYKTIEIIIEESPWIQRATNFKAEEIVYVSAKYRTKA
jgi:hypothetical protein